VLDLTSILIGKHIGKMFTSISQFEPLFPSKSGELEDLARNLVAVSAKLEGRLSPVVLADIRELLRVVNSYYSNLIEGNGTHPIDIERAMAGDYSSNIQKRELQIESRIHIEVQRKISERLKENPNETITNEDFLCWVHHEFYERMPENLRWANGDNGEKVWVEAGKLRERLVKVGRHIPPVADSLNSFLSRFEAAYNPLKMNGLRPIIALSAAHHRLMWIHPFLDGNGRVARLFTDAYFEKFKLEGYGLWNVSRGLARKRNDYRKYLAAADFERENDFDGRGNLSDRTLTDFCRFFLETCLDQAEYMNNLLSLNGFLERLEKYVQLRNAGLIVDEKGEKLAKLHPQVGKVFCVTAVKGEILRGEVFQIIEMSERTGRTILKNLLDEGLLLSKSEKGLVRLGFPTHAAGYWFPDLYPNEVKS
jgi:Fic family protein